MPDQRPIRTAGQKTVDRSHEPVVGYADRQNVGEPWRRENVLRARSPGEITSG